MGRGCGKFTFLSGISVGSAVGTFDFILRANAKNAVAMSIMAGLFAGSLAKNVSMSVSDKVPYWEYKRDLDERLRSKLVDEKTEMHGS
ncbi:hypothetical protein EGR_02309 [Echinococcus granulosus]|uniref:Uncharacterized protein n=1 Tax=Echinococcus granulosus TaxID=6210 RepID=W6UNQ2_ECHGR|nr:hypothetical protein EGR_02309 [Echinococcus granulosus]EUB62868.1 hypothetical protein EGR_02309 [Echinococcus granulosus]